MTFYEAALRVLEGAGRPLHFQEITERSIAGNLLSHVGKTPEQTMLSRLLAMARRTRDRKVIVTAKDTFALVDWSFPEDPEALAATAAQQENPEEALPPYRPPERHPEPRLENVRVAGRGSERKRRHDEDEGRGKRRRYPPLPEVIFEILSEAGEALPPPELAERARVKELASEELSTDSILSALLEDNQRRIDSGRRPQFLFRDGEVWLDRAGGGPEVSPQEIQATFAAVLGIPLVEGRLVLARNGVAPRAEAALDPQAFAQAKLSVKEAKRAAARALKVRLGQLEAGTFEKSVIRMMQALGFRELKVAKRSKEGPLVTARKREGSLELRYAVRILKGGLHVERRSVQEVRRDLGHTGAQIGVVVSTGEARSDARGDATSGALVLLWCGEGLADKFLEARTGVKVTTVELYESDERFFEEARVDAEDSARRREERRELRQREDGAGSNRVVQPPAAPSEERAMDAEVSVAEAASEASDEALDEADDERETGGEAALEGQPSATTDGEGAEGQGRRRRRRRRGRRGRGAREGEQGAVGVAPSVGGEGAAPLPVSEQVSPPPQAADGGAE